MNSKRFNNQNKKITMTELTNETRINVLATIDELNQYLNGNVTKAGLQIALSDLIEKL